MRFPSRPDNRPSDFGDPKTAYAAAQFLCGQFAKTVTVFLRHDFGERYFNIVDSTGAAVTFVIYIVVASLILSEKNDGFILWLFLLFFILISILHLFLASRRMRKGRRWHSRYTGTSYLAFLRPNDSFFVQRWIEPILVICIGSLLAIINRPLGAWLIFAGLSLAAVEQIAAQRFRNKFLDTIDAQIEAEQLSAAISGKKPGTETEGFALPIPTYYKDEQRAAIYSGMTKLDPALQAMIDEAAVHDTEEPPLT